MKLFEVFWAFFRLGLTSFGGPVAHLGYFHDEFVLRKNWISEHAYADLVSLCQFLPGPASSQVGMALGLSRAGYLGAFAAWLGFTLPSAVLLILFAFGISNLSDPLHLGYLHGLKIAAVAVVAQAIWLMGRKICPDIKRTSLAIGVAILVSYISSAAGQITFIISGAIFGIFFLKDREELPHILLSSNASKAVGLFLLFIFVLLLIFLPFGARFTGHDLLIQFDSYYRVGAMVFGGGHVVLPLLKNEIVSNGWVSNELFVAGYGAAQAIPGPLFALSAYLGTVSAGISGAILCLVAAFLPSYLLIVGILPFWEQLRKYQSVKNAMNGINVVVVGLLAAAFYHPLWTSAIFNILDFTVLLVAFGLLFFKKAPSWLIVILCSLAGRFIGS